jgi:hypothetical protein
MADKNIRLRISETGAKQATKALGGVDNRLKSLAKSAAGVGIAYFGARGIINGLQKSIELSGKFQGISTGFQNLGKQAGFTTSALDKFINATDGTISSLELMEMANNTMLLGITDSEDQMAEMFDIAQRLAKSLGQDTRFGIESLITGLGRQSKLMLDNLGIMVDIEKANEEYAESIGKTASELTDQEKKQAFVNTTLATAKELVKGVGDESLTTADTIAQLKTAVDEAAISVGNVLAPVVITVAKSVQLLAEGISAVADGFTSFMDDAKRAQQDATIIQEFKDNTVAVKEFQKSLSELSDDGLFQLAESFDRTQKSAFNLTQQEKDIAEKQKIVFEEYKNRMAERKKLQEEEATEAQFFSNLLIRNAEIQNGQFAQEIDIAEQKKVLSLQNKEFISESLKLKEDQIKQDIRSAAIQQGSAKDAMKAVVRAESMEAVVGLISSILKSVPFPFNTILAAGAGATAAGLIDKGLSQFATGGDFVTSGPQMIMVGDNAGGRERVQVTPLSSPNINGPQEGININFNAPVTNDEYVRDFIIPEIKKATRMNLA